MDKKQVHAPPMWQGRQIIDDAHAPDLEQRAAVNEFDRHMDRHDAEQAAHEGYVRDQRMQAAAHHLAGIGAAQGTGDMDEAAKHGSMFQLHMQALGLDPAAPVPDEIRAKLASIDKKKIHRFKPHDADIYAISERESPAPMAKSEASEACTDCEWPHALSTRKACRANASRKVGAKWYCHDHADMAAKMDALRYRNSDRPKVDTPNELHKCEDVLEKSLGHQPPWVARDGLVIPRSGTADRAAWDRKFVTHILGKLGVDPQKVRAVRVRVSETIPRNPPVNAARADLYEKMAKSGEQVPPIMVERLAHGWHVVDGNHRVEGLERAGRGQEVIDALDVTEPGTYFYGK